MRNFSKAKRIVIKIGTNILTKNDSVDAGYVPKAGDRIEVYRPLKRDPRETRRALAARGIKVPGSSDPKA